MHFYRLASTLGSESAAREPQSEQTLYICIRIACREYAGTPAAPPHEELNCSPVIDIHAGLKNSLKSF